LSARRSCTPPPACSAMSVPLASALKENPGSATS
jgi:hypothetical protein